MFTFLLGLITIVVIYYFVKKVAQWALFRDRASLSVHELYKLFSEKKEHLDEHKFQALMGSISKSYHISVGKLRPDDSFNGRISKWDSWDLWHGTEQLQLAIAPMILRKTDSQKIDTLQDLANAYCDAKTDNGIEKCNGAVSGQTDKQ